MIPDFTVNDTICTVTYSLTNSDDTAYDTSVITFYPSNKTLKAYSTNYGKAGTYHLKITGLITGFTQSTSSTFDLVLPLCD